MGSNARTPARAIAPNSVIDAKISAEIEICRISTRASRITNARLPMLPSIRRSTRYTASAAGKTRSAWSCARM